MLFGDGEPQNHSFVNVMHHHHYLFSLNGAGTFAVPTSVCLNRNVLVLPPCVRDTCVSCGNGAKVIGIHTVLHYIEMYVCMHNGILCTSTPLIASHAPRACLHCLTSCTRRRAYASQVMEKLEALFEGFQYAQPPPHFVLMGNFCSSPITHGMFVSVHAITMTIK